MKLSLEIAKTISQQVGKGVQITVNVSDLPDDKELAEILSRPIFYERIDNVGIVPDLFSKLGTSNTAEFFVTDDSDIEKIVSKIKKLYEDVLKQFSELKVWRDWREIQHVEYKI